MFAGQMRAEPGHLPVVDAKMTRLTGLRPGSKEAPPRGQQQALSFPCLLVFFATSLSPRFFEPFASTMVKFANYGLKSLIALPPASVLTTAAAFAKPVSEAVSVISDSETTDPNGFKWMIICIALLVFVAFTLIGVTIFYFAKAKKDHQS
jgi:hypothetical protein